MSHEFIQVLPKPDSKKLRFFSGAPCGWPSPAADYEEAPLSLDELVGITACSTFLIRARGDSMIGAGIYDNDVLVVDRGATAALNKIIVAVVDGDFTVKRLGRENGRCMLIPENPTMKPMVFDEGQNVEVWGVVRWNLHQLD
jgi:DNA polymerase V